MATPLNINEILTQVKRLDKKTQLNLLQRLTDMIKPAKTYKKDAVRLSSLSGLGSEVWKNPNHIDRYIDEERQW